MFSFLIGLQATKARLTFIVKVTCDWLISVGWLWLSSLHYKNTTLYRNTARGAFLTTAFGSLGLRLCFALLGNDYTDLNMSECEFGME